MHRARGQSTISAVTSDHLPVLWAGSSRMEPCDAAGRARRALAAALIENTSASPERTDRDRVDVALWHFSDLTLRRMTASRQERSFHNRPLRESAWARSIV